MRADNKIILGVSVVIVLILMTSVYSFIVSKEKEKNMIAETEASIIDIQTNCSRESDGSSVWTITKNVTVTFHYQIDGELIERKETLSRNSSKNFKIGETAKICYNPQNHSESKLVVKTFGCGK